MYLGEYKMGDYVNLVATTHRFSSGAAFAPASITYTVYKDGSSTEIITATAMTNFDGETGFYYDRLLLSSELGYSNNSSYVILIKATVDSVAAIDWRSFKIDSTVWDSAARSRCIQTQLINFINTYGTNINSTGIDSIWDEVITSAAHGVDQSAAYYIRRLYQTIVTRVMQATGGGNSTITLDGAASAVNDYYKGQVISIFSGTGTGQARACTGYDGGTKIATIGPAWATNPDATSWFAILNFGSSVVSALDNIDFSTLMKTSLDAATPASVQNISAQTGDAYAESVAMHVHVDKIPQSDGVLSWNTTALAAIGDAIHDEIIEGTITHREAMRLALSVLTGISFGGGTPTVGFRDIGNTKTRISATVDQNGNRTAIGTRDGT